MHADHSVKAPKYRMSVLQQLQLNPNYFFFNFYLHSCTVKNQLPQGKKEREWLGSGSVVRLSIAPLISLHSKHSVYTNTPVCTFLFT